MAVIDDNLFFDVYKLNDVSEIIIGISYDQVYEKESNFDLNKINYDQYLNYLFELDFLLVQIL